MNAVLSMRKTALINNLSLFFYRCLWGFLFVFVVVRSYLMNSGVRNSGWVGTISTVACLAQGQGASQRLGS